MSKKKKTKITKASASFHHAIIVLFGLELALILSFVFVLVAQPGDMISLFFQTLILTIHVGLILTLAPLIFAFCIVVFKTKSLISMWQKLIVWCAYIVNTILTVVTGLVIIIGSLYELLILVK